MRPGRDRGLTLLELVVAMAVFALVAVMGLQALTGVMRARGTLTSSAQATEDLARGLVLLRRDMANLVPVFFAPPTGRAESAFVVTAEGFDMSVGDQWMLETVQGGARHRAVWTLDRQTGVLSRKIWPTLLPAFARQESPAMEVMRGVRGVSVRGYVKGQGWLDGKSLNPGGVTTELPNALEITLQTEAFGAITLLETQK